MSINNSEKTVYLVVQEGGSSNELYPQSYDTLEAANAFRKSCRDDGAYRTCAPIPVPESLESHPQFFDFVSALLASASSLSYAE